MVGGVHTHLDDMLASQYQSIGWAQHTTCLSSISVGGNLWFLAPRILVSKLLWLLTLHHDKDMGVATKTQTWCIDELNEEF